MTEAIDADFGVHVSSLSGYNYPIGKISRRSIYNSNPRTFEFDRHFGYNVYATRIRGVWISLIARVALRFGLPMFFSGLTFDYKIIGDSRYTFKYKIKNLRYKGKRINPFKNYKVALSEAIIRGGMAITPFVKLILKYSEDYKIPMWLAIEDRVRNYRIIDDNYLKNRPPYGRPNYVENYRGYYQSTPGLPRYGS